MHEYLKRWPELKEFINEIDEKINKTTRPPEEVILDDVDLRNFLKISKRQAAKIRSERRITFYKTGGRIYYSLRDVLNYVKRHEVSAIQSSLTK